MQLPKARAWRREHSDRTALCHPEFNLQLQSQGTFPCCGKQSSSGGCGTVTVTQVITGTLVSGCAMPPTQTSAVENLIKVSLKGFQPHWWMGSAMLVLLLQTDLPFFLRISCKGLSEGSSQGFSSSGDIWDVSLSCRRSLLCSV